MASNLACTQTSYQVTQQDLPLSCPMPGMELWNAHPRVYLAIEETGEVLCPYCSAHYQLINFVPKQAETTATAVEYMDESNANI
jgi:uncharacterized Zn-finger protein